MAEPRKVFTGLTVATAAAGLVVTLWIMFGQAGGVGTPRAGAVASLALFALWAVVPYLALLLIGYVSRTKAAPAVITLVGALAVTGCGLWAYYEGFYVNLDAQSALLFVFVPVIQLVGCAVLAVTALVFWLTGRRALRQGKLEAGG
jgi:hypothetical protein